MHTYSPVKVHIQWTVTQLNDCGMRAVADPGGGGGG